MNNELQLCKPAEAAKILDMGLSTVYRLAANGVIPSMKISGAVRFDKAALARFIQEKQAERMGVRPTQRFRS
jgi:excisionase family DNA binding protein